MRRPAVRCLPLVSMLLVLAAVPVAAQDPPAPPETKSVAFAHIEIKGDYPEAAQPAGLFGDIVESLADALKRLDRAAEDDAITGVVLEIEGPDIGWAKLNELRRAVVHVQKSGKRVYAVVEQPGTMDYLLAAQCDQVIMPESGVLMLVGLQAEVLFYKNLFELLDIKAEMLRVGDYKAAAEPYTRTEMSPEYKQNMTAILDDYWRQMIEMIAAGRKLDKQQVEAAIDSGPHTAAQAKQLGLIDTIAYEDQLEELLGQKDGEIEVALQRRYGKKKIDTDFSGLGGMIKLMNLLTGGDTRKRSGTGPKIAVITGTGIIMTGRSANDPFLGTITMGSETMIKAIRKAKEDDNVKAVVLRVDSPGGSALASDLIWRELETLDKPFVVSMGDVAGSGGYYIAMGADHIFAEPGTLTGSIGVVGGKLSFRGLLSKIGVTVDVIERGENAGALSVLDGFSNGERAAMQKLLESIYEQFTHKAAQGRQMELEKLKALAGGRVYTGVQAKENGLVDELGTLDDAVDHAARLAGLDPDEEIERLLLPEPVSPLEALFGPLDEDARLRSGRADALSVLTALHPELADLLQEALVIHGVLSREARLTVMPFRVRVK